MGLDTCLKIIQLPVRILVVWRPGRENDSHKSGTLFVLWFFNEILKIKPQNLGKIAGWPRIAWNVKKYAACLILVLFVSKQCLQTILYYPFVNIISAENAYMSTWIEPALNTSHFMLKVTVNMVLRVSNAPHARFIIANCIEDYIWEKTIYIALYILHFICQGNPKKARSVEFPSHIFSSSNVLTF